MKFWLITLSTFLFSSMAFADFFGFSQMYCLRKLQPALSVQLNFEDDSVKYDYFEKSETKELKDIRLRSEYSSTSQGLMIKTSIQPFKEKQVFVEATLNYQGQDGEAPYAYPFDAAYTDISSGKKYKMACIAGPLLGHEKLEKEHRNYKFSESVHKTINYCFHNALDHNVTENFESKFTGDAIRNGNFFALGILNNKAKRELRDLAKDTRVVPKSKEEQDKHKIAKWNYCERLSLALETHLRRILKN